MIIVAIDMANLAAVGEQKRRPEGMSADAECPSRGKEVGAFTPHGKVRYSEWRAVNYPGQDSETY